jgi:general secretion pathway protein A
MYESFFGLSERPFDLTPNPKYLFLTAKHREALSNLQYGISGRKGITLLIGEAGTGKTTLIQAALASFRPHGVHCVSVNNPALTRDEFYEYLAASFGLSREAAGSKARFLIELEQDVLRRHAAGGITALLIDEAQSMPLDLMEEVRLLANLETPTVKLMPLVLVGQPELATKLDDPEHCQLKQRVALRYDLAPLTIQETAAYIAGRIRIAGGDVIKMFTRDAVELIHRRSRGIPRTISVICDNALVGGFAAGVKPVGRDVVTEVCRDFKLGGPEAVPQRELRAAAPADVPPRAAGAPVRPGASPAAPDDRVVADSTAALAAHLRERFKPAPEAAEDVQSGHQPGRHDQLFGSFSRRRRFFS